MNANLKAAQIKSELFDLVKKMKDLQAAVNNAEEGDFDLRHEAGSQADQAAVALASVYENLGDFFTDAHRDTPAFSFAI